MRLRKGSHDNEQMTSLVEKIKTNHVETNKERALYA